MGYYNPPERPAGLLAPEYRKTYAGTVVSKDATYIGFRVLAEIGYRYYWPYDPKTQDNLSARWDEAETERWWCEVCAHWHHTNFKEEKGGPTSDITRKHMGKEK